MTTTERILLVEDDAAMLSSCRQALEEGRFRVVTAATPKTAEPILSRNDLDLVITDLRMPHGGGMALVDMVRHHSPETPVMIITAYPSVETAVGAFKGGVVDYLTKPFTGEQLVEAVRSALAARRAREHAELLRRMEPAPSLKERPEVIPHLAVHLLDGFLKENPQPRIKGFSDNALELLAEQPWPGNAAELRQAIQKSLSKAVGPLITADDLRKCGAIPTRAQGELGGPSPRRAVLQEYERAYLVQMLEQHEGNVTYTAEALGIHRVTLQRLIKKLGITKSSRSAKPPDAG